MFCLTSSVYSSDEHTLFDENLLNINIIFFKIISHLFISFVFFRVVSGH